MKRHRSVSEEDGYAIRSRLFHRLGIVEPVAASSSSSSSSSVRPLTHATTTTTTTSTTGETSSSTMSLSSSTSSPFKSLPTRSGPTNQFPTCHKSRPTVPFHLEPLKQPPLPKHQERIMSEDRTKVLSTSSTLSKDTAAMIINNNNNNASSFSPSSSLPHKKSVVFAETVQVWYIPRRDEYSHRLRQLLWPSPHQVQLNVRRNTMEFWYEGWKWQYVMEEPDMYVHAVTGERIHPVHVQYYNYCLQQQQRQQQQHNKHAPPYHSQQPRYNNNNNNTWQPRHYHHHHHHHRPSPPGAYHGMMPIPGTATTAAYGHLEATTTLPPLETVAAKSMTVSP